MENNFAKNLQYLRNFKGLNKSEMPSLLNLGRSTYYGYESGDSFPTFQGLIQIADFFGISLSEIVESDLSKSSLKDKTSTKKSTSNSSLKGSLMGSLNEKFNPKSVHEPQLGYQNSRQKFNVFDTSAAAGDAMLLFKKDQYRQTPNVYLPGLGAGIHIRVTIAGDSMHSTIKNGDKVVATQVTDLLEIRQGHIYIMLDKEDGLVCKRLYWDKEEQFELISDNEIYPPYKRHLNDISAIFRVREVHSTDLRPYWEDLRKEMRQMHNEINDLRRSMKK